MAKRSKKPKVIKKFKNIPKKTKEKVVFQRKREFPSISRFIPEFTFRFKRNDSLPGNSIRLIFAIVIVAIVTEGIHLFIDLRNVKVTADDSITFAKQAAYWQMTEKKYPNYRDGYFQLALLAYRVGDNQKANEYLQQVETLDPNFEGVQLLRSYIR